MISTQLDLFGGPPKPPKNIREEEPPAVVPQTEEKPVEPVNEPEPEMSEGPSGEPELVVEQENIHEEMPEWIEEPVQESNSDIDEEPANELYTDAIDDPIEYDLEIEDEMLPEDEPISVEPVHEEILQEKENVETSEVEPNKGVSTNDEPISEIVDETVPKAEQEAVEEYNAPVEVDDVEDYGNDAEEGLVASIPEDTVHVQLPSHDASPVHFTALIPVEDFMVEEEPVKEIDEVHPQVSHTEIEDEIELTSLENDSEDLELQDEESLSPPFMVEAINTEEEILGGEPEGGLDDPHTLNGQEIKDGQLQIPVDEKLFLRQYYTMRETSNMFGVNQSLLRYWENEFDVLKPKKNRKGDRYFRPEDIKNLELIYHLLKVRKFTIEGAREYIKSKKKVLDIFELVQRLEKLKFFLHELKTHL